MKHGNWVPISKAIVAHLPKTTPYDRVHAIVSIQVSIDNKSPVSITGLSRSWKWSQNKVRKFLKDVGAEIFYTQNTSKKQNQKGVIKGVITEGSPKEKGVIRIIINSSLYKTTEGSPKEKGVITEGSKETINEPNNNNPKPSTQKSGKVFPDNSLEMKISKYLFNTLLKSDQNNKNPNFQSWCIDMNKILRIDKRRKEDIKKVIDYAHNPDNSKDGFSWIPNLRSPRKLRDHFTTILLQCEVVHRDNGREKAQERAKQTAEKFGL